MFEGTFGFDPSSAAPLHLGGDAICSWLSYETERERPRGRYEADPRLSSLVDGIEIVGALSVAAPEPLLVVFEAPPRRRTGGEGELFWPSNPCSEAAKPEKEEPPSQDGKLDFFEESSPRGDGPGREWRRAGAWPRVACNSSDPGILIASLTGYAPTSPGPCDCFVLAWLHAPSSTLVALRRWFSGECEGYTLPSSLIKLLMPVHTLTSYWVLLAAGLGTRPISRAEGSDTLVSSPTCSSFLVGLVANLGESPASSE